MFSPSQHAYFLHTCQISQENLGEGKTSQRMCLDQNQAWTHGWEGAVILISTSSLKRQTLFEAGREPSREALDLDSVSGRRKPALDFTLHTLT